MNSSSDPPGITTRSMTAKRKAEEARTDVVPTKKSRFSAPRQHSDESSGVITRSMTEMIKLRAAAEEENATMNVVIAKRGKRRRQRLSKKLRFSGPYHQQNWSLPESIMYYIIKNPTAKSHEKLIRCCKYFFAKNPVFVIRDLMFKNEKWQTSSDTSPIDIAKIAESKLWISGTLIVEIATNRNLISSLIPKINRCDIVELNLWFQTISYNDFCFIASSVERLDTSQVTIEYDDGSIVPFEKIVEALPKVQTIYYTCEPATITSSTLKELVMVPHFSQLQALILYHIPETFDLDSYYAYMKQNKITRFDLNFHDSISEAYKIRLEAIIDEIIETQPHDYKTPMIFFSGLDFTKFQKLYPIYLSH